MIAHPILPRVTTGEKDTDDTAMLSWDGFDDQGKRCTAGTYTITVEGGESDSSLYCFVEGTVSGVRFTADGPAVVIDGKELSVGDILTVN